MTDLLRIEHLSKSYTPGKLAVNDLTLNVAPGEIYGFIGHNGAGKTTTLRAAVGILDFEGDIFVGGHSIKREPVACKRMLAYIPDNPDLYDYLSGLQYLAFIGDIYGVAQAEREARTRKYSELFALAELGDLVGSYSHGMKQKLALIAAFLHDPKLLVLDEPFVGLDPQAAHAVKLALRELCDAGGAVFFSTHVLEVAEKLCDKIAIIKAGSLVASGDTQTVRGDGSLEQIFLEIVQHA